MNDDHQGQSLKQPAIRDSIAAPMMGAVLSTLMRQGGVASLLIIALVPERSELAIGLAFLIMQWSMLARVFAAPFVDLTSRQQFLLRWGKIAAGCSALLVSAPLVAWIGRPDLALAAFLLALVTWGRLADAWGTRLVFALGSVVGAALLLLLPLLGRLPRLTGSDTRGDVRRGILAQRRPGSD